MKKLFNTIKYVIIYFIVEWLRDITEAILYHVTREKDFKCRTMRILIREIIANNIFFTTINMLSNPDYVNQLIIWLVNNKLNTIFMKYSCFFCYV